MNDAHDDEQLPLDVLWHRPRGFEYRRDEVDPDELPDDDSSLDAVAHLLADRHDLDPDGVRVDAVRQA